MNRADIIAARRTARRFIDLAIEDQAELGTFTYQNSYSTGTATSGALRRASMDLTRALAKMRGRQKCGT